MGESSTALIGAIEVAMEAERKAALFYTGSIEKASSGKGRDLLRQLAAFEEAHFDALEELKHSLAKGGKFIAYEGTRFASITGEIPAETDHGQETNLDEMLDILRRAIDAETAANERYIAMARDTDDPLGKEMFVTLAQEEMLHRRILSDEYYHLHNKGGLWSWGD